MIKQKRSMVWPVMAVAIVVVFLGALTLFALKKQGTLSPFIDAYVYRLQTWMAERKAHLDKKVAKVKQLTRKQPDTEQDIHFEFYTALPSMKMTPPPIPPETPATPVVAQAKPAVPVKQNKDKLPSKKPLFNADQINQELSKEFRETL